MKKSFSTKKSLAFAAAGLVVALGLLFVLSSSAFASTPNLQATATQDGYPAPVTATVTATVNPNVTLTPTATLGAATLTPTVTVTGTRATLQPPARTGTATMLVPVTGADLGPGSGVSAGIWVALWLIGLLLVFYGLRTKMEKR